MEITLCDLAANKNSLPESKLFLQRKDFIIQLHMQLLGSQFICISNCRAADICWDGVIDVFDLIMMKKSSHIIVFKQDMWMLIVFKYMKENSIIYDFCPSNQRLECDEPCEVRASRTAL